MRYCGQSSGKALGPRRASDFGHVPKYRNVCQKKGGHIRATTVASSCCRRSRCCRVPGCRPAPRVGPIKSSGNQKATYPTVVQAVGGTISRGDRPLQGSSGMVVQVGPHGCMGPPSTSGAGVGSRASIHRAEDACLLAAAWWIPLTCGPGCCASPTRWPRNGQPDQCRPPCSRKEGPCFWPQARFRHLVKWRRCRRPMACSCPDQCGRGGRQAVSTSLLKGRARTLPPPPSKSARAPKLAPTCRSRRPHHASRPMAQATQEYNIVIHWKMCHCATPQLNM